MASCVQWIRNILCLVNCCCGNKKTQKVCRNSPNFFDDDENEPENANIISRSGEEVEIKSECENGFNLFEGIKERDYPSKINPFEEPHGSDTDYPHELNPFEWDGITEEEYPPEFNPFSEDSDICSRNYSPENYPEEMNPFECVLYDEYPQSLNPFTDDEERKLEYPDEEKKAEEYPTDLNPFFENDESTEIETVSHEKSYPTELNPFFNDDDEDEEKCSANKPSTIGNGISEVIRRKKKNRHAPMPPLKVMLIPNEPQQSTVDMNVDKRTRRKKRPAPPVPRVQL